MESKLAGRSIEVDTFEGWDWRELPLVDPSNGGATRAELDALRLIAVFISHWDNKNPNQRLVCVGDEADGHSPHDPCAAPAVDAAGPRRHVRPDQSEFRAMVRLSDLEGRAGLRREYGRDALRGHPVPADGDLGGWARVAG